MNTKELVDLLVRFLHGKPVEKDGWYMQVSFPEKVKIVMNGIKADFVGNDITLMHHKNSREELVASVTTITERMLNDWNFLHFVAVKLSDSRGPKIGYFFQFSACLCNMLTPKDKMARIIGKDIKLYYELLEMPDADLNEYLTIRKLK